MSLRDAQGHAVSTSAHDALAASEQALWRMMSFYGTPVDDLDAAIAADPGWLLPRVMKAGFLLGLTEPSLAGDARATLAGAAPLAARANERERAHLGAVQRVAQGDWRGASAAWEDILLAHPRDALALQWALLFDFYRGDARSLRERVARVLPQWSGDEPLHPYVLGLHAFGLEESNLYAEAEAAGRRALAGRAQVPWAIHAVAHVMEMQGRHDEGGRWMSQWRPHWGEGNGFAGHLGWHEALFALESLDHDAALAAFDRYLNPAATEITLQRVDAASLLWRLQLHGADVGARWQGLLGSWNLDAAEAGLSAFNDVHALIAMIGASEVGRAETWAATTLAAAEGASGWNREVMRDIGAPLLRGLLAFATGDFDGAAETLYRVRPISGRLGGSHAQRDVIDQTLLAAAARGSNKSAGRALLNERLLARPRTPLAEWWTRSLDISSGP
jgi:hypothetical protein